MGMHSFSSSPIPLFLSTHSGIQGEEEALEWVGELSTISGSDLGAKGGKYAWWPAGGVFIIRW